MRVKLLFATISLLVINHLQAQTIFWSEDFGTGCSQGNSAAGTTTLKGTWTVTNVTAPASDANQWYISATEAGMGVGNCGDGCLNNSALDNRTLHIGSVPSSPSAGFICPTGDCGAGYDSGGGCPGFGCVSVNDRVESPVIDCSTQSSYTLSFLYFEGTGDITNDYMEVMYSADGGTTWSSLATPGSTNNAGCPLDPLGDPQGNWTAYSIALPASANNNPNVKIGFRWQNNDDAVGNDPSVAIDDVQLLTSSSAPPTVTINTLPNDSMCLTSTLTLQGAANPGPITQWAWTVNPTTGVAFNPDTTVQNPTITFTTPGTYTFTLFATSAGGTGDTTQVITVLAPSVPSVTITASPVNPICVGSVVGFTATPTNGGSSPSFTWSVNGVAQAGNTNTFSSSTLGNNDIVSVTVTPSDTCVSPAAASDSYTVQVVPSVAPSVTITSSATVACAGTPVSFTATPTNGGTTPAFQWQINGVNAGSNSSTFSSTFNNNDTVRVILTSNDACASPATDTSNLIGISITPTVVPSVAVAASATSVCAGTAMNFTATPTNGGATPAYQWQVNGVNAGVNSAIFSSSSLSNGDTVAVVLTSNVACPVPSTASDTVFAVITPTVVPAVSVAATPTNPVCATTSIDFTATPSNGGATPSYQWQVNGVNAGSNSPNFTSSPWANNDVVTVTMTSSDACPVPSTASATYVVNVVVPTVTATAASVTVCPGIGDSLFAAATPANAVLSWSPAAGLNTASGDTVIATNAAPGTYTYYVTATFMGCSVTDSVNATVNNFTVAVGPPKTICYGDSTLLFVTGGSSWNWMPNLGLSCDTCQSTMASPSTSLSSTTSTTYSAIVSDSNGICTDTVTETVTVIPNASPAFSTNVLQQGLPQLIGFTNNSTNATSFFWNLGNGNTSVMQTPANQHYPVEGAYTVTLIAYGVNGCNDTTQTVIMVKDTIGLTVPNVFTPNDDGINDVWKPSAHGTTSFSCIIYDRWGIQMYEFINSQDQWDGHTTAGLTCTEGTYFYILKATDKNNKSYNLKGFIQLIR